MKKNIIKSIMVVAAATFAGYNMYQSNRDTQVFSDVVLDNVEALAGDELGANGCYATICYKKCKKYIYESTNPCLCNLCTGK